MKNRMWAVALCGLGACASRTPLFSASLLSMTKYSYTGGKLVDLGLVEAKFCTGEPPRTATSSNVGLIDEVIFKAQQSKSADYIANALVSAEGQCVTIEGQAVRKSVRSRASLEVFGETDRSPATVTAPDSDDFPASTAHDSPI